MAMFDIFKGTRRQQSEPEPAAFQIPPLPIRGLIDAHRRDELLKLESHLRGTQHDSNKYDWDGNIGGSLQVEGYVPMKQRKPCVSMRLGKVVVKRLTTMICGHDRFPTLVVEGDEDAEDFIRQLSKEAKLRTKLYEARNKGGAAGTVVMSWGFVKGKPRISIHSAALCEVLEWEDFDEKIPARVLKIYDYKKRVFEDGRMVKKTFWFVRYWDENVEVTWREIHNEVAKEPSWVSAPHDVVEHDAKTCPVIWVQNIPDSDSVDGISDFDGQADDFDELDRLTSATERGTVANVDPTLVIHDRKRKGEGVIRKGTGTVIYSKNGASYLELNGTAVSTSKDLLQGLKASQLEEAEVVLLDPEKLSGSGVSAAALRVRFAPMLAKCDIIRDQYGDAMTRILSAMIEAARSMEDQAVTLEPKINKLDTDDTDDESPRFELIPRTPGESSAITLKWPPYFPATWQDRKDAVETTKGATGKQVLSRHTAIESMASMFDIDSVDNEIERIEKDEESASQRAKDMFDSGGPAVQLQPTRDASDIDDEEEEPEEK